MLSDMLTADGSVHQSLAERFAEMWMHYESPPDVFAFLFQLPQQSVENQLAVCIIDQTNRWQAGVGIPVEQYLERLPEVSKNNSACLALAIGEFNCQQDNGHKPELGIFLRRFPGLADAIKARLATVKFECDTACETNKDLPVQARFEEVPRAVAQDRYGSEPAILEQVTQSVSATRIGRYSIMRLLGDGGFGRVYLGRDEILHRDVAIKVPHPKRVAGPADIEAYLTEARILAKLDHTSIVPVYDCGTMDDGLCFVVSKFIDGGDLATKLKRTHLTYSAAAELIAKVAEALHFAHLHGVVHRDVKPANILIDSRDQPILADFGIALKEEDFGKGHRAIGTVPYMSPEQLRSEGHLVDGRTDIFSLGVVLYELLAGRRPFPANRQQLPEHIDPRPLRQVDDTIPQELERICLKALAPRLADRYSTALDFSEDLRHFLSSVTQERDRAVVVPVSSDHLPRGTSGVPLVTAGALIVPKGLRSFDRNDADFFLGLLPGPRTREGVPESVHFWKFRVLETDSEKSFRVGLIIGPSGCGKSSFLKAGVLPTLQDDVISIYVEATRAETETRLLNALRKEFPFLPRDLDLADSFGFLRRSPEVRKKVLVVLDQFEQWLHSRARSDLGELGRALRQCDGGRLQAIVTARDDFWLSLTQFMSDLEVDLIPGNNVAVLDLFSTRHGQKILAEIGQAYGAIPGRWDDISADQRAFIKGAVASLAHDDQIVPVQLALFGEMVKDRPWHLSTLKELGGGYGIGVRFLEDAFNGRTAAPSHRLHQKAARNVLKALLSEFDQIKGSMQSYQDLLQAAGYENREDEFEVLIRILDSELRLITPTDPDGKTLNDVSGDRSDLQERYYHLTHDYLVPSIREWLTRKQRETHRGRAELLLTERAGQWKHRPSRQNLFSVFEWLDVMCFTTRGFRRSEPSQSHLLRASAKFHGLRLLLTAIALGIAGWAVYEQSVRSRVDALISSLEAASTQDVPRIVEQLVPYQSRAVSRLYQVLSANPPETQTALHAAMALLPDDKSLSEAILEKMLSAPAPDFVALSEVLWKYGDHDRLSNEARLRIADENLDPAKRFRAGAALLNWRPQEPLAPPDQEPAMAALISQQLIDEIRQHPGAFSRWIALLQPARQLIAPALRVIYLSEATSARDRLVAAEILAEYFADAPEDLAELAICSNPDQYDILSTKLRRLGEDATLTLGEFAAGRVPNIHQEEPPAKQRAHAAVALLDLGQPEPLLQMLSENRNPGLRTYVEDRLSQLSVRSDYLADQLERAINPALRGALLRILGGIAQSKLVPRIRPRIIQTAVQLFETDADPGVHSAAQWLLRKYEVPVNLPETLQNQLADCGWYITPAGFTMVVFRGPTIIRTGSPDTEPNRDRDEEQVTRVIPRDFALATTEVTLEQYLKCHPEFRHRNNRLFFPSADCPVAILSWHHACLYCLWLSEREGIPSEQWCYRQEGNSAIPYPDYLHRTGYRLPTEAEWEYACRAGSAETFAWGSDPALCNRYEWTIFDSLGSNHSVATKCPNAFGFFDMQGNAGEWIQEPYRERIGVSVPDRASDEEVPVDSFGFDIDQVVRGGTAAQQALFNRSANRTPTRGYSNSSIRVGFRIARTLRVLPAED